MKLVYDLPPREAFTVSRRLENESILCCIPYDLSMTGKYLEGWLIITASRLLCLEEGQETCFLDIKDTLSHKTVKLNGNGTLEVELGSGPKIIARYTMRHIQRMSYASRMLNNLVLTGEARVRSTADEERCPRCGRVLPEGTKVCSACLKKLSVLKRVLGMMKEFWPLIAMAVLCFVAITTLQLVVPYIYRRLVDDYLVPMKKELGSISLLVGCIALSQLSGTLLNVVKGRIMCIAAGKLIRKLRLDIYARLQQLTLGYIGKRKTGDLMNRVTGDTAALNDFIEFMSAFSINQLLILAGVCTILFMTNWRLTLLVILPVPVVIAFWKLIWRKVNILYHAQRKAGDKANSLLQDILSGIRAVKAFGQEEKEIDRFKAASYNLAEMQQRNEKFNNTIFPTFNFFMGFGQFLVLYYGSKLVLGHSMRLGELVQFTQYTAMLYGPLTWLSFLPNAFANAMTAAQRIFDVLDEEPDIKDNDISCDHDIEGSISFKNVSFGYEAHEPVLESISLEVEPGEMIGLVGHSGAGKSTLINLVMRLYEIDQGQILMDGIDIRDISQESLRSQIGVVLQETFLFSGSILENIRYSKPEVDLEDVIKAAKVANAHDFIMKFPDAYNTKVGENGHKLSGGERQRIAIARAILHDPKVLILDEATSSLDTETEQQIQEALSRLTRNRTTFAIAHRLSTLRNANRLMVIEKGKLAELGTHEELLRLKGIYYKLIMAQRQLAKVQ